MKSHYELLGVDISTNVETIKKAFRREIARYHPDKVVHLGPEFQEIASTRAAELTAAYTTLTDPDARAAYDAVLASERTATTPAPEPADSPSQGRPAAESSADPAAAGSGSGRQFEQERVGQQDIMRRAALARLREALKGALGACDIVSVNGFDLACLSQSRSSLFRRSAPPSVLVRMAPLVDRRLTGDAWTSAVKAALPQKPLILLLLGHELAPTSELSQAIEEQRRKNPALVDAMYPVPVDLRDWSAKIPANAPDSVRSLIETLKNSLRS